MGFRKTYQKRNNVLFNSMWYHGYDKIDIGPIRKDLKIQTSDDQLIFQFLRNSLTNMVYGT
jgi:hypothetical protein